jgi:tetratricopeptide (TPR) repeat protein
MTPAARVCLKMSMRDRVASLCRESARSRGVAFACAVILAGCGGAPRDLVTGSTDDLELHEAAQPELRKTLQAGHWLVEVRERDIDLATVIDAPRQRVELLDSAPRHGVVVKVVSLETAGEIRVQLRSVDHPTKRGGATVRVARFRREAGAGPGLLEQGYSAWSTAAEQNALKTREGWSLAADRLNEAITLFDGAGDHEARGTAAYALATLQYSRGEDGAVVIRAAEIAADEFGEVDDDTGRHNADTVRAAAEINLASGMNANTQRAEQRSLYGAADRRLAEAVKYFDEHRLPLRAAYASNLRGIRAVNLGDQDDAAAHFSKALELSRASQDVAEQVRSTTNLAWTHRLQGHIRQAAEEFKSLLPLLDPKRQTYLYGVILNNYGFCLIALGDFDEALALHTEALDLFERLDQKDERATQLTALGALYFRAGDTVRALETLRSAIAAQESISDTRGLAGTLRLAGNAAAAVGQHDMALEYLRRSAAIDTNPHDVSRTRVLIAGELRVIGDLAGADAELAEALRSSMPVVRADALAERARLHVTRKKFKEAIADLRTADAAYAELGIEFSRIDPLATLSQLLLTGDIDGASKAADEAVGIVRRLRVNSSNPEWRARFWSAQYAPFEARIAVDLARGGEDGVWQGFRNADEVRARSLADQLAGGPRTGDRETEAQIARLRDTLNDQNLRLDARVQAQADETGNRELRREIEETRARLDAQLARREAGAGSNMRLPESLRSVQQQLPPDTVVLAFFVGDTGSHAWLLGRDRLKHLAIGGRGRVQQAIDAVVADHPRGSPSARDAQGRLSAMLFGNLLDGVKETRMLVIPDGPLHAVPFAALPLARTGDRLLIDQFLVGYSPSLALALSPRERPRHATTRVAVVSDPVYARDDRRLPAPVAGNKRGPADVLPSGLYRLPYSALEERAVIENFGRANTTSLAGFDATPERVRELAAGDWSVLHFATHALARKSSPERSALFLSEFTADGTLHPDSQFTANDVMRTGLKADLVVLSACATGEGDTLRGEGVLGLTYSFLANGSGTVVASLWQVEDATTARLMNEFYRAYRASGNAAEALRSAQLRIRGNPKAAAVWSSFVVRANGFP